MNDESGNTLFGTRESDSRVERYLGLDDKEKDIETQKAMYRLHKRISEILYFIDMDTGMNRIKEERR